MITRETVKYVLYDGDLRQLFALPVKDLIKSVETKLDSVDRVLSVTVTVERPVKGRWFKKVQISAV